VIPIGRGSNDTMFPAEPFDLKENIEECKSAFGVPPRPHWITTYYGGHVCLLFKVLCEIPVHPCMFIVAI